MQSIECAADSWSLNCRVVAVSSRTGEDFTKSNHWSTLHLHWIYESWARSSVTGLTLADSWSLMLLCIIAERFLCDVVQFNMKESNHEVLLVS